MKKTVKRYEVKTGCCYTTYYFNKESNCFDNESCYSCNENRYSWETKEEMLRDFFDGFNPYELRNSADSIIRLCEITETWTRDNIEDEWDFETEEESVLIEFKVYDWLKNNGMIIED